LNILSTCYFLALFSNPPHVVHRGIHRKLAGSHELLIAAYTEAMKRPCMEDYTQLPNPNHVPALHASSADREEPHPDTLCLCSKSDFPNINFWTKGEWLDFKNKGRDSLAMGSKAGPWGGTRCAQGTNVVMQYLEDANREPINGQAAADIWEFTRKIWAGFYDQGMAPKKWNKAKPKVRDKYTCEIELWWPVVCYCKNHWKAHRIAIDNYPQWYKNHCRKRLGEEAKKSDKPATKKWRMIIEDDENVQSQSKSETNTGDGSMPEGMDNNMDGNMDSNASMSFPVGQDNQEVPRGGSSRPWTQLLALRDPLWVF
jgi:hypothetical protein